MEEEEVMEVDNKNLMEEEVEDMEVVVDMEEGTNNNPK